MFELQTDRNETAEPTTAAPRVREEATLVDELLRENRTLRVLFERMERSREAGDEAMTQANLTVFGAFLRAHLSKESRFLYPKLAGLEPALAELLGDMHKIGRALRVMTRDVQSLGVLHGEPEELAALLERRMRIGERVLYPLYAKQ